MKKYSLQEVDNIGKKSITSFFNPHIIHDFVPQNAILDLYVKTTMLSPDLNTADYCVWVHKMASREDISNLERLKKE